MLRRGHRPTEPVPCLDWIDDGCAGMDCGCGDHIAISDGYPTQCPNCRRIFQLRQLNWIEERDLDSVIRCQWCGGLLSDSGNICMSCLRDKDGKTSEQRYEELQAFLTGEDSK